MAEIYWIPVAVTLLAATVAAVTDIWKFRVYNALTFPLMASGFAFHTLTGGYDGFVSSGLGLLFGLGVLFIPHLMGLMGAGDVKLLAGVGAWLCLPLTVTVFVVCSLVAGVYAMALILLRGKMSQSFVMLKLIFYRFAALGIQFGRDDLIETIAIQPDRRLRLIPFGATVPLGIIGALIWVAWKR